MQFFLISLCVACLAAGSYTDIRTREVPDWVSYFMIFSGIGLRLIYSIFQYDFSYIIDGLLGLGIAFGIALIMFYTGQWGGGDSKIIMGVGALIGITMDFDNLMVSFILNSLIIGSAYGLIWLVFMLASNFGKFKIYIRRKTSKKRKQIDICYITAIIFILSSFLVKDLALKIAIIFTGLLVPGFFLFWIFIKTIEDCCMIKEISVNRLTEGDWIVDDIKYRGKVICGPKDLGISREQIKKLKDKGFKTVKVKEGMPFVPNFLISFLVSLIFGNLFLQILFSFV